MPCVKLFGSLIIICLRNKNGLFLKQCTHDNQNNYIKKKKEAKLCCHACLFTLNLKHSQAFRVNFVTLASYIS